MWDEMILNRIYNDSLFLNQVLLMSSFSLISLRLWNILTDTSIQVIFFKDQVDPILPCLEIINFTKLVIKMVVISNFEMRTSNGNNKDLGLIDLKCLTSFWS